MSAQVWFAAHALMLTAWLLYCLSTFVLVVRFRIAQRVERACWAVRNALRPFALLILIGVWVADVLDGGPPRPWWVMLPELWTWYAARKIDGDDDRWKRRREKLSARVAEVAGRLTVVPQT